MRIVYSLLTISLFIVFCGCTGIETSEKQNVHNLSKETQQNNQIITEFDKGSIGIKTGNTNVAQQDIYKNKVVWSGGNHNELNKGSIHLLHGIYLYDIEDKSIKKIATSQQRGQTDETQVNNEWICWSDWNDPLGKDWVIYAYSFSSGKIIKIDAAQNHLSGESSELPRLSLSNNGYLVWTSNELNEHRHNLKGIYLSSVGKEKISRIATTDYPKALPFVTDNYVIWNNEKEIKLYSINENKVVKSIVTATPANYPKANNQYVTWQEGNRLFIQDIDKESNKLIFQGEIFFYGIGKNHVVWQNKSDIFSYNINNKVIMKLNHTKAMLPYIRNDDVVWQEQSNDEINLKVVTLTDNTK
ncbi:hypothetical protein [Paenibacillus thiaminolyticus]|uniref:Uncharacterized protein n=1 Tax=Paenibacillus thiaminolyticus TaxID=49283 RepID=A0A3A3G851_PANTH|nr:hypothetical protein [Paenibacillus thiaminolyticus]RJG15176.1 hypothetical protein DQX05_29980 [Paenibacillus thiaminolyticus]